MVAEVTPELTGKDRIHEACKDDASGARLRPRGPVTDGARAGEWPDDCEQSALPTEDPDYPNDQLVLTCLPANFNGTLLIYAHGYVRPQEPLALPEEFANADIQEIIQQLLDLGFGVATSSYHKNGYAVEQAEADLNDLVDYVESSEADVDAVYITGASEGALIATMLVEKYPETYAGGLALCGPLAGVGYQIGYMADVRVLFDYFYPEVFPFGTLDVPDDAHEQWDGSHGFKAEMGRRSKTIPRRSPSCSMLRVWHAMQGTKPRLRTAPRTSWRIACLERTTCWKPPAAGR